MVEQIQSVHDALAAYDKEKDREHVEATERERQQVTQRFPLDEWPQMPLERYALGQPDSSNTYCYWLEVWHASPGQYAGRLIRQAPGLQAQEQARLVLQSDIQR